MNPLVLIVEDEPAQAEVLRYNLEKKGYRTSVAPAGEEALMLVEEEEPDLVILDWMLPDIAGIEICRQLKTRPKTRTLPVIMLTARGEEDDRVRGLESGADDYVVKPYSPSEMIARVQAVLRRSHLELEEEVLEYTDIRMDLARHRVTRQGKSIHLGPSEFRLLRVLMERPTRVFSREQLLDRAWGRDVYVESRTVDVHIRRLRKALNISGSKDIIRTVRGSGYALDESS
tara:strand:+ start:1996 stop:2685 length:690 start_codon:yes stop_codon:yes gene_type:complete